MSLSRIRTDQGVWESYPMPEGSVVSGSAQARVIWARAEANPAYYAGVWQVQPCVFDWVFDMHETAHIVEGFALITPQGGEPVEARPGDVFSFPKGMRVRWDVREALKKVFVDSL